MPDGPSGAGGEAGPGGSMGGTGVGVGGPDPTINYGRNYFGLQAADFNPGIISGTSENSKLYESGYNPWLNDSDPANDAMMGEFEARFTENSEAALAEYAELSQKKYGYSFQTLAQGDSEITLRGNRDRQAGDYIKVSTQSQGLTGKAAFEGGTLFVDQKSYEQSSSPDLHKVNAEKLTAAEEYMLYRYQRRDDVSLDEVGTGETEYNFDIDEGGSFAHKATQQTKGRGAAVQIGASRTNRADRAAGKSQFKAAQL